MGLAPCGPDLQCIRLIWAFPNRLVSINHVAIADQDISSLCQVMSLCRDDYISMTGRVQRSRLRLNEKLVQSDRVRETENPMFNISQWLAVSAAHLPDLTCSIWPLWRGLQVDVGKRRGWECDDPLPPDHRSARLLLFFCDGVNYSHVVEHCIKEIRGQRSIVDIEI